MSAAWRRRAHGAKLTEGRAGARIHVLRTPRSTGLSRRTSRPGPRSPRLEYLAARRAVRTQWAHFAGGTPGRADAPAMEDQGVVEEDPLLGREGLLQVKFDLVRIGVAGQGEAT